MFSGLSKSEQPARVLLAAASSPARPKGQGSTGMGAGSAEHWAKRVGLLACFCCAQPSISNLVCRRKGVHGAFMMHEVVAEEHICSHTSNSHLRTLVACLLGEATALSRLFCRNSLLLALDSTKPKEIPLNLRRFHKQTVGTQYYRPSCCLRNSNGQPDWGQVSKYPLVLCLPQPKT